ncbi:MAG: hypothetical protein H6828_08215 [Planctomycetes bacterium]|nr:hypothetical protein [Planctomycetota bacterium]
MRPMLLAVLPALAAFAPDAAAQYIGSPFSYDYVELDYHLTNFDRADEWLDGYGFEFSMESNHDIRILGRFADASGDAGGVDASRRDLELGIGFHDSINRQLDATLDFKFLRAELEAYGDKSTEVGYGIEGGLRGLVNEHFEVHGGLEFRGLVKTELGGRLGALARVTQNFGVDATYTYFGEQQSLQFGVRFSL